MESSIVSSSNSDQRQEKKKLKIKLSKEEGNRYKNLFMEHKLEVPQKSKKVSQPILESMTRKL